MAIKQFERVLDLQLAKGGRANGYVYRGYPRRKFAPLLGLCGDGCGLLTRALAA